MTLEAIPADAVPTQRATQETMLAALRELQLVKEKVVAGAGAATNIAVAGVSATGTILAVLHLDQRAAVWSGGVVTAGDALTVDVTAVDYRKADGTFVGGGPSNELALAAAHATLARIDLIQFHTTTGVITKKDGVAGASPAAPAPDSGNVALATVAVAATVVVPGAIVDQRVRPLVSLVDRTSEASITAAGIIQLASTDTTGDQLSVLYVNKP